jgi:hypothetical protein
MNIIKMVGFKIPMLRYWQIRANTLIIMKVLSFWERMHNELNDPMSAKYFGGGMKITPTADPSSNNLEVTTWSAFIL